MIDKIPVLRILRTVSGQCVSFVSLSGVFLSLFDLSKPILPNMDRCLNWGLPAHRVEEKATVTKVNSDALELSSHDIITVSEIDN